MFTPVIHRCVQLPWLQFNPWPIDTITLVLFFASCVYFITTIRYNNDSLSMSWLLISARSLQSDVTLKAGLTIASTQVDCWAIMCPIIMGLGPWETRVLAMIEDPFTCLKEVEHQQGQGSVGCFTLYEEDAQPLGLFKSKWDDQSAWLKMKWIKIEW